MKLEISNRDTVSEVQRVFNDEYPFLKLEFYKTENRIPAIRIREHIPQSTSLQSAGLRKTGHIDISNEMTVGELEHLFMEQFGLVVQVCRNSGGIWLETTMTDNWSLQKQNDYGKEIIKHTTRNVPDYDRDA